jgi:hypothetical protein
VRGVRGSSSLVVPAPVVIDDERADRLEVVMLVVELHRDAMTEIVWLELGDTRLADRGSSNEARAHRVGS